MEDNKEEGGCDCGSCPGCGTDNDAGNEPEDEKSPEDEDIE